MSASTSAPTIALLPGDGIGRELAEACGPLLRELTPKVTWLEAEVGWECWRRDGDSVPAATWEACRAADAVLLGAITSKPAPQAEAELASHLQGKGLEYRSPTVQLRRGLDLFANVRPVEARDGSFRFMVVRENTEGMFGHDLGVEDLERLPGLMSLLSDDTTVREANPEEIAVSLRVTTGFGWRRLLRVAAKLAKRSRGVVTVADKPNVLPQTGAVLVKAVSDVQAEFPDVQFVMENADAVAMRMVTEPERYDVIAAENLIGDMLSDLGAGLGTGLGVAPSASYGTRMGLFEPVHGSAPDIAGQGIANPVAFLLSAALCFEHVGEDAAAARLRVAVESVVQRGLSGDGKCVTFDLGGVATTAEMIAEIRKMLELSSSKCEPSPLKR